MFPFRLGDLGASEEFSHKLENDLNLRIMAYQVTAAYETDVEHAHLTVISSRNIHTYYGKYLSDKSGYARSGVDLSNRDRLVQRLDLDNEPTETMRDTNPYCPTEGAMLSNYTPLVIEGGNELPAKEKHCIIIWIGCESRAPGEGDVQVESS